MTYFRWSDLTDLICRHIKSGGDVKHLSDRNKLKLLVQEELQAYGLSDSQVFTAVKMLCHLFASMDHDLLQKRPGCEDLVRWVYSDPSNADENASRLERLCTVNFSSEEFAAMKQHTVEGAARILISDNAGGNSRLSEAYSFQLLYALLRGQIELLKTEMEIEYVDAHSKITDYSIQTLNEERIAVSVTRACGAEFDAEAAKKLLAKKLLGIKESSQNVSAADGWRGQMLHCWCENAAIAQLLSDCFHNVMTAAQVDDTFVLLSIVDDEELFYSSRESSVMMRTGGIKLSTVKNVFSKEVAARPSYDSELTLTEAALACRTHAFYGDPLGGLHCQICSFATTARVWKCKNCDVALCGSCMDKWKSKINK